MILPLILLLARAVVETGGVRGLVAIGILSFSALTTFLPWRALDKYDGYRGMRPWAREIAADPSMSNALILVRGERHPDFASAAIYNPLDLYGPRPVFAWDREIGRAHV